MLTKRDKILVQPWEQRKYDNHIRKVQTALPVIDNKPPVSREHVSVKLKKRVKELERIKKIENENLILLRKMNYIMKTNRVDNYWTKPLPNFLNRVTMFDNTRRPTPEVLEIFEEEVNGNHIKKGKCSACTPKPTPLKDKPEERVPWDPPKQKLSRTRSKSVPVRKNSLPTILEKQKVTSQSSVEIEKPKSSKEPRMSTPSKKSERQLKKYKSYEDCFENPQKLTITRGSLKLCVNFPPDSQIKLHDGIMEKTILKSKCYCRKHLVEV